MKLLIVSYHDPKFHPIHVSRLCYIFFILHLWVIPGLTPWLYRSALGQISHLELQQSSYFHLQKHCTFPSPTCSPNLLISYSKSLSFSSHYPSSPLHYHAIRWLYHLSIKCKLFPNTYPFNIFLYTFLLSSSP